MESNRVANFLIVCWPNCTEYEFNTGKIHYTFQCYVCILSCAIRILCHVTDWKKSNDYAHELLVYFVKPFKHLYGEKFVTLNVHSLIISSEM